jgi:sulfite reductase beta subunit-like hemoprotein
MYRCIVLPLGCTTDFRTAALYCLLQNGRIKGDAKKALRGVIEQYGIPVTLSANQNILLRDVEPAWKEDIQARLEVSNHVCSVLLGLGVLQVDTFTAERYF